MTDGTLRMTAVAVLPAITAGIAVFAVVGTVGLATAGAVGFVTPGIAESAESAAPLGQTGATTIDSCTTITEPGRYVLTADVEDARATTCIEIRASDVRFDGAGHAIDGQNLRQASAGVSVAPGTGNVTVRDFAVIQWAFGVRYEGVGGGTIADVRSRFSADGIHVADSRRVVVQNATVEHGFVGVSVADSTGVAVRDTVARWNAIHGVSLAETDDATISNLTAANDDVGIGVFRSAEVTVRNATVASNRVTGVELVGSESVFVSDATILGGSEPVFERTPRGFVAEETHDLSMVGTRDSRVEDLTTGPNWSVRLGSGSVNDSVTVVEAGSESVSFAGSGVVVSATDSPSVPSDYAALDAAIRAEPTASNATLSLDLGYSAADLAVTGVSEATLALWRYDDGEWESVAGQRVDSERNRVTANLSEFSVFAVVGERDGSPVAVTEQFGFEIEFACDWVRVSGPPGASYSLVVHYFDPATDTRGEGLLGPLSGTTDEPFDSDLVFTEVGVLMDGRIVASGYLPDECSNAP